MRESITGFTLFNIVIAFIILFAGYISMSINYSKAYNVKNEILNIIKNQGGVCTGTSSTSYNCNNFKTQITDYFNEANYRSTGDCQSGWTGYTREGDVTLGDAAFCVYGVKIDTNTTTVDEVPNSVYYKVEVFYQLDIPIFSSIVRFSLEGETGRIYNPNECQVDPSSYSWCS